MGRKEHGAIRNLQEDSLAIGLYSEGPANLTPLGQFHLVFSVSLAIYYFLYIFGPLTYIFFIIHCIRFFYI